MTADHAWPRTTRPTRANPSTTDPCSAPAT